MLITMETLNRRMSVTGNTLRVWEIPKSKKISDMCKTVQQFHYLKYFMPSEMT